jgi:hypothetical protein
VPAQGGHAQVVPGSPRASKSSKTPVNSANYATWHEAAWKLP